MNTEDKMTGWQQIILLVIAIAAVFVTSLFNGARLDALDKTLKEAVEASKKPQPIEYRIVMFCRDTADAELGALQEAAKTGWRYVGPLEQNGINCQYVLLGRPAQ